MIGISAPAHGVGSRQDLPLPFSLLVAGTALALVISFLALGLLWKQPRLSGASGRPVPDTFARVLDSRWTTRAIQGLAVAVTVWTLAALFAGKDNANNPAIYAIYVWLWVGLVFASVLVGPLWSRANPVRLLHRAILRASRLAPDFSLVEYRLGWWPAAGGLLGFTWMELVAPDRATTPVLAVAVLTYLLVSLLLAMTFGTSYFAAGDPFEAYSRAYGGLSMVGRRDDRQWVLRSPLQGVHQFAAQRGTVALCSVLLGGTAYDSFSGETRWYTFVQSSPLPAAALETVGLVLTCAAVAASLFLASALSATLARRPVRGLTTALAPALIPIAAGYVVAHYWSLLVVEGVHGLAHASDPLGIGADWLFTAALEPNYTLIEPDRVASIQITAILVGHLLGVVMAHDRALRLFERRVALAGQIPLLALMVGYTVVGLSLLFTP